MSTPHHLPEFVYRLATGEEWAEMQKTGAAPKREIDVKDGYFHLSTRDQALETARIHFSGVDGLLALEIPLADIKAQTKFELAPKRGEEFPHLFGELLLRHVKRAVRLERVGAEYIFGETV